MAAAVIVIAWRSINFNHSFARGHDLLSQTPRPDSRHALLTVFTARIRPKCRAWDKTKRLYCSHPSVRKTLPAHTANIHCPPPSARTIASASPLHCPLRVKHGRSHVHHCPRLTVRTRPSPLVRAHLYLQRLQDTLVAPIIKAGLPSWNSLNPVSRL